MAANLVGHRITPVLEPIADDRASIEPTSPRLTSPAAPTSTGAVRRLRGRNVD
jgi:hypothetical protein